MTSNRDRSRSSWPRDYFAWAEVVQQMWWWLPLVIATAVGVTVWSIGYLKKASAPMVVVYASQDQVYAEPILKQFEQETGIQVRAVYDSEAVKTVGLANRLLAERARPRCDVFWGNEELRTRQLAAQGVFRETNGWAAFGYRSRRVVLAATATNLPLPESLLDLTNETYRGRIALAYPLFGTTATHLLALRQLWGESNWLAWCQALAANQPYIVDGNSVVVRFVLRGEASVGLTDSDDIAAAGREGAALMTLPITSETLLIPNTAAVIRHCRHPQAAQRLFEYLQRGAVADALVQAQALEGRTVPGNAQTLQPDWAQLLRELEPATEQLKQIFRR